MRRGTSVHFVWVPRHVGLSGNEVDDMTVKAATHSCDEIDVTFTHSEICVIWYKEASVSRNDVL